MRKFILTLSALSILLLCFIVLNSFLTTKITIAAGPKGGFFDTSALLLKKRLKEKNIDLRIINREDTIKIIDDVNDQNSDTSLGFVAQDLKKVQYDNVEAVGSLILEPLFIFHKKGLDLNSLNDFKGLKLGVGPDNSGTRLLAETILQLYGINQTNASFVKETHSKHLDMIQNGNLDVGFFLLPANNNFVFQLGTNPNLQIFSLDTSSVISRKFDYLYAETVKAGGFDLINSLPEQDIRVIALPVNLIAKKNLDPSIMVAISSILKQEFRSPNLISDAATFPSMDYINDLPINKRAKEIIDLPFGSLPFLYKYLPFQLAGTIDKFGIYLSYILTLVVVLRYTGFPYPFRVYKMIMYHTHYKVLLELHAKSSKSRLSRKDLENLKVSENYFKKDFNPNFAITKKETIAENNMALKLGKKIRKNYNERN